MEENIRRSSNQQPIDFLKKQINEFAESQLKNAQALKIVIDQFKAKQSTKDIFQKQQFAKNANDHYFEVQNFFENVIAKMISFPILEKLLLLLNAIGIQYLRIFRFSNQKWENEYKILEQSLRNSTIQPSPKIDLCPNCMENKWHQQIKSEKHRIFNMRIQDPFFYYQQATYTQKESNGEETDHKKLQEKLSELALGVQMQQKCLRELINDMNHQEETANETNCPDSLAQNQSISLSIMPMLRTVFNHARGAKKSFEDIGIQTIAIIQKPIKVIEQQPTVLLDLLAEKDKLQCKLITEITDKTMQIKGLQEKISQSQKSQGDLKAQQNLLVEENITLQKKNSFLEVQLTISRSKQSNKFKIMNKKKSIEKAREDQSTTVNNKSYNTTNNPSQYNQESQIDRPIEQSITSKIRGNGVLQSKFKTQQSQNKTMFIPNLHQPTSNQRTLRQSITPGKLGSTISIDRSTNKLDEQLLTSVADFPSISPSIHSNSVLDEKITTNKFSDNKLQDMENHEESTEKRIELNFNDRTNKSKKKLKQITKAQINSETQDIKKWIRSQNPSPQIDRNRRKGKFQDRQSLLRMLFDEQVKENNEKTLNFDYFKKSYENFVIRIIGVNDFSNEKSKLSKINHLHKKSTVSIKQYFRNQINDINEQISVKMDSIKSKDLQRDIRYPRFSACFKDIMNNLFPEETEMDFILMDQIRNEKVVLANEELATMTEILAYMIQLKVSNLNSYTKVKTIISIESGQNSKGKSHFQEKQQSKQLKSSISAIINCHRKCKIRAQNKCYCIHISSFIKSIIALMEK